MLRRYWRLCCRFQITLVRLGIRRQSGNYPEAPPHLVRCMGEVALLPSESEKCVHGTADQYFTPKSAYSATSGNVASFDSQVNVRIKVLST